MSTDEQEVQTVQTLSAEIIQNHNHQHEDCASCEYIFSNMLTLKGHIISKINNRQTNCHSIYEP